MIGVLALQGGFAEHMAILSSLNIPACEIRTGEELMREDLRGLIIPGGESTVMIKFIDAYNLRAAICERARDPKFNIYGTCAGLIVLATNVPNLTTEPLKLLDVDVERNAYGRQLSSFVTDFGSFIRAPKIIRTGSTVEILRTYHDTPVFVRQGNLWATTYHPELIGNTEIHRMIFDTAS